MTPFVYHLFVLEGVNMDYIFKPDDFDVTKLKGNTFLKSTFDIEEEKENSSNEKEDILDNSIFDEEKNERGRIGGR